MPDFLRILAVDSTLNDLPKEGDDDLDWQDLQAILARAAAAAPDADFTLLCGGAGDWVDIHAWTIRKGASTNERMQLSLERDVCRGTRAEPAPEVALSLDVDGDDLIDLIDRAAGEYAEENDAPEGRELFLPFRYEDEELLLEAAAAVAAHITETHAELLVEVDDRYYELRLSRDDGAALVPLWPWLTEPAARALLRQTLPAPGIARSRACPRTTDGGKTTGRESAAPFTAGSIRSRIQAAESTKAKRPGAYEQFLAAWTAPENRDARADGLRQVLAKKLIVADAARAIGVLRGGLRSERDSVRETIYDALSRVESESASRVLIEAYRDETESVRELVGQVLWRREATIELLVREGLISAWTTDVEHGKRIVRLLKEECLPVHRTWLVGATPDLVDALASRITEGS